MDIGKMLLIAGVMLIVFGLLYSFTPLFKLPGDILIKRGNFTFYFPVVTSLLLGIILSLVLGFFLRR